MVRGVIETAGHNPGAGLDYIEEFGWRLPPRLFFFHKLQQALFAVPGVAHDEFDARFHPRERRSPHIDFEHGAKPKILTDALVNHLFANTAAARVRGVGTNREIVVRKFTPNT